MANKQADRAIAFAEDLAVLMEAHEVYLHVDREGRIIAGHVSGQEIVLGATPTNGHRVRRAVKLATTEITNPFLWRDPMSRGDLDERLRRTGRTTRMLEHARELADLGHTVYVVVAFEHHAKQLQRLCNNPLIKFETAESLGNFDWQTMRLRGAHPNCRVLADHFAIEHQFAEMLRMLHQYDPPTETASN